MDILSTEGKKGKKMLILLWYGSGMIIVEKGGIMNKNQSGNPIWEHVVKIC